MAKVSPGTMLAERYRVERHLGEGGMAEVYQCLDTETGERVAIKLMHEHLVADHPDQIERFRLEARLLVRLSHPHNHPNVIEVRQVISKGSLQAIVMELVEDGLGLDTYLEDKPFSIEGAIGTICQALRGLHHLHHHGIIHRDIKPSNILMAPSPDGVMIPKIADLGIALDLDSGRDVVALTAGDEEDALGSPPYMAPELFDAGDAASPQSDVYAFGVTLYELLVGQVPFPVESLPTHIMRVAIEEPPRLKQTLPHAPDWLDEIIAISLAKDAAERFPDAGSFYEALASQGEATDPALRTTDPAMISGDYHVKRRLGRGPVATVYDCIDVNLNVPVAIKLLRGLDPKRRERFVAEARAQSALHQGRPHRNISAIRLIIAHENTFALVMERVAGIHLDDFINEHEPGPEEVIRLFQELCDGLDQAHGKGVLHHNLHPRNVLITHTTNEDEPTHVKITDFGMDSIPGKSRLDLARSRGVLPYLPPEFADDSVEPTVASDLYSFGALMLLALTRKRPPSVVDKEPTPGKHNAAQRALPPLPPALATLLEACLSSDPSERPESAKAAFEQLSQAALQTTMDFSTPELTSSKRSPLLLLTMIAAIIAAGVVAGLFFSSSPDDAPSPTPTSAPPDTSHHDYLPRLTEVATEHGAAVTQECFLSLDADKARVITEKMAEGNELVVTLKITLTEDASVQALEILQDDLSEVGFGECLVRLAREWTYPTPPHAGSWEWTPARFDK